MKKLNVIIETADNNYAAYVDGVDGIAVTGSSVAQIKERMQEAIKVYVETCNELGMEIPKQLQGDFELAFVMDTATLLAFYYGIFSMAGMERITGIHQKQLWHYATGQVKPRPKQRERIETALHKLGSELSAISL